MVESLKKENYYEVNSDRRAQLFDQSNTEDLTYFNKKKRYLSLFPGQSFEMNIKMEAHPIQQSYPHPLGILAQISSNHAPISLPPPQKEICEKQEVRTKRYISVTLGGLDCGDKRMVLAWYEHGNGIPESCYVLVPQRQPHVVISLKNTQGKGWVEVDTVKAAYPEFLIEFQIRIEFADVEEKVDDVVLRFVLKDKEGDKVKAIGESSIAVSLKCTKNKSDSLIGQMKDFRGQ